MVPSTAITYEGFSEMINDEIILTFFRRLLKIWMKKKLVINLNLLYRHSVKWQCWHLPSLTSNTKVLSEISSSRRS